MTQIVHIDEIRRRLQLIHGDRITIIPSTYRGVKKHATFIDVNYGQWETRVAHVLAGKRHPAGRKTRVETTCRERFGVSSVFQSPQVQAKRVRTLLEHYGVDSPLRSSVVKARHRATCIQRYGVENPMMNAEIHAKALAKLGNTWVLTRWNDQKPVRCVGSYELAFVQWCNDHQIEFDWQIPHRMPDGRTYIIDAFIKTGVYANTWVEIKGYFRGDARMKWEWFHAMYSNSSLWDTRTLKSMGIIGKVS
jgi:hypothetical protein